MRTTVIVTALGPDSHGLLAQVATTIAEQNANIDDVSQTVANGMFTMIMFVSFVETETTMAALKEALTATGERIGLQIHVQHEIVTFCNVPEDNPFMAGAMHGSGEPEVTVNVAIAGPGVVRNAVASHPEASLIELADLIKRTTFKITRVGELVAREASQMLDAQMGIIDL